jgi:hypothetical protein
MLLAIPLIVVALAAGSFVLALASDGFAYELSRVVEAAFDAAEYRLALRRRGRAARSPNFVRAWPRRLRSTDSLVDAARAQRLGEARV